MACYFVRFTTFNSLLLSVACLPFRRILKKIQLRTWTKKVDVSSAKITNGDTVHLEIFSRAFEISRQLYSASSNYSFFTQNIQPLGVPIPHHGKGRKVL